MIPLAIENATRRIGKSQGYKGLAVLDAVTADGEPVMLTAWEPTPAELARLNKGAPVYLWVMGIAHPPVKVEVGE